MKLALSLLALLVLAACGGGGGSAPTPQPSNRAPVADAGADRNEDEQVTVTLDGTRSSDPDGDNLSYAWSQTSGVAVTLAGANTSRATFASPNVGIGSSVSLSFQLQVSDRSQISSDSVTITVDGVSNSDPVVDAGSDRTAPELTNVGLAGTASDADIGDTLSYTWTQLSGPTATIADPGSATTDFDAPDVGANGEVLVFQLAVDDGTATVTDAVEITVIEPPPAVAISGKVQYEFVPPAPQCFGLDFVNTEMRPIRAATVQLIEDGSGNVLASTVANDEGDFSFSGVSPNTPVRLRVRAELKNTGALPNWDVEVRDNVDPANSLPLAQRPLYVVEGGVFDTGVIDQTRNLTATTGWDGSSYSDPRAAAPFAVLDTIYQGMLTLLAVDPTLDFVPLDAFWSVNNVFTPGSPLDVDNGELPASLYIGFLDSLFLVGDASVDTDEFDIAIVAHEWSHYLDDNYSRSDSIGGPHRLGRSLDPRLAFGEGLAYALAGIIVGDPQGCDTGPAGASSGGSWNVETFNAGLQGWFNEMSVATFVYDLWDTSVDTDVDGTDDNSIGFDPIWNTLVGPMRSTDAFTTLFSFAAELRPMLNATELAFVDSQLDRENIDTPNVDIWGDGQTTAPGSGVGMLPVYTQVPTNGSIVNVCAYDEFTFAQEGNKLAERRYLRFTTTSTSAWTITAQANPVPPPTSDPPPDPNDPNAPPIRDRSDPDMFLYRRGQPVAQSISGDDDLEVFATPVLAAGTYTVDLQEFRYADANKSSDFPGEVCYDVSINP